LDQTLKYTIAGDSSSLVRASETAKQAGASLTAKLSSGFNETTISIQKSVAAVSAMQARINAMVGLGGRATKEWTGALAQQGEELDRLRAKYSPLFAAQQSYLANLNEIKAAHAVGAIGSTEMAAAIAREKAAFAATVVNMNRVGGAAKLTSNQLLNLSRQGNDVVTMFALGAPPMQIFASQAGQIYDALEQGPGGLKGSLKAIGEGILGLVRQFPLATAAIAAAGVAFAAYELIGRTKVETLDEILKNHEKNIRLLGDAYDAVSGKQQKYAQISAGTFNLLNEAEANKIKANLSAAVQDIYSSAFTSSGVGRGGGTRDFVKAQFAPFADAIRDLKNSAKDTTALRAFTDAVTEISRQKPDFKDAAVQLLDLSRGALEAASALPEAQKTISDVADVVADFQRRLDGVTSEPIRKALQEIFDKAKDGQEPLDQIIGRIATLQQTNPSFSGIIAGFTNLITKAYEASAAVDSILQSGPVNGRQKLPVGILPDEAPTPDARPNAEDIGAANDKRLAKAARAANPYRDILKSADDRIKQMRLELSLMGQVGEAADTLRNYQELLSRATDKGRTVGEKQKKELHDRAAQMAALEQATKAAKIQQDLLFESQQMFRSSTEQDVFGTLRDAGIDYASAAGQAIAAQIRLNDQLRESRELAGDFVSTFFDGLKNGESVWKSFGDAALSVLDKIADKLLNEVLDAVFQVVAAGNSGGGSGGLFGFLGSLFGGSSNVFPGGGSLNSFGGLYANGGVFEKGISGYSNTVVDRPTRFRFASGAGLMGEAGPEGILPLRRNSAGQLGVMAANTNQTPAANQNIHVTIGWSQTADGNLRPFVESVSQATANQAVSAYDGQMPARVKQINMDPRKR